MTIIESVELFTALNLLFVGLSHFFQPQHWVNFFEKLSGMGDAGNLFNAMLSLGLGSIIFAFHQVWQGPMLLVTVYGLLLCMKGGIYLVFPSVGIKSIKGKAVNIRNFKIAGVIMTILAVFIMGYVITV